MNRSPELDFHLGRVLMLLRHFGPYEARPLRSLTKLAKLDFLLRYPMFTDRLLEKRHVNWALGTEPTDAERVAVESRMVRYKYGPWDDRYYSVLGALCGLGLVGVQRDGAAITAFLTDQGRSLAASLAQTEEWGGTDARAGLLKETFDLSGNALKKLIYAELPDAVDRPHHSEI